MSRSDQKDKNAQLRELLAAFLSARSGRSDGKGGGGGRGGTGFGDFDDEWQRHRQGLNATLRALRRETATAPIQA